MTDPRTLLRAIGAPRRLLAAGLAAAAVALALTELAPTDPTARTVFVAAHDLLPGTRLTSQDVVARAWPAALVPSGAQVTKAELVGRLVAGAVRSGEPLTDARLVGPTLLSGAGLGPGTVALAVRVGEPATADLVRAGDRVDVFGADPGADGGAAVLVATDVLVLAVSPPTERDEGTLVVLAAAPGAARALAGAAASSALSLGLRATA